MTDRDRGGEQPTPPRTRLEDEVLEILVRADQPTSIKDHRRQKAHRQRQMRLESATRSVTGFGAGAGAGTFLVGCLVLALMALLVESSSPLLARLLAIGSVAALAMIWVRRYRSPGGLDVKRWRGQEINSAPPPPAWVESLRDRFRRPPRR